MPNVKSQNAPGKKPKTKRPRGERIPPDVRQEALRLVHVGVSNLEIAKRLGIAEGSVRYMRRQVRLQTDAESVIPPTVEATLVADAPEPSPADVGGMLAGLELGGDLTVLVRGLIGEAVKTAKMAAEDKNSSAAAKALRDAISALPGLIRLEKASAENVDAVSIPRDKIAQEIEAIYVRMRTLESVEMCPRCGCELRMAAVGALRDSQKESK